VALSNLWRLTGSDAVRFSTWRGHGREPLSRGRPDANGWVVHSIFPVRIEVGSREAGEALKSVKEQLRRIPNRGITYGLLRYQSSDPSGDRALEASSSARVGFNYWSVRRHQKLVERPDARARARRRP